AVMVSDGFVVITVTRTDTGTAGSVNFMPSPRSAIPGADYTPITRTLAFAVGQTTQTIKIPILNTPSPGSPSLTFTVSLVSPQGLGIGTNASTVVTITNTNVPPSTTTPPTPSPTSSACGARGSGSGSGSGTTNVPFSGSCPG